MSFLVKLPRFVFVSLVVDWIKIKDICCLDTAMCNGDNRQKLLGTISNEHVYLGKSLSEHKQSYQFYVWCLERRLLLKCINLSLVAEMSYFREQIEILEKSAPPPSFIASWKNYFQRAWTRKTNEVLPQTTVTELDVAMFLDRSRDVSFANCFVLTKADLTRHITLNKIRSLDLTGCIRLPGTAIAHVASISPGLQLLNLSRCNGLTNADIFTITTKSPQLTSIDISHCPLLTSAATKSIAENCLDRLVAYYSNNKIPLDVSLLERCGCLKILSIPHNTLPSDVKAVMITTWRCESLEKVDFSHCYDLDRETLLGLTKKTPLLKDLNLAFCNRYLSDAVIAGALVRCVNLTAFHLRTQDTFYSRAQGLGAASTCFLGDHCPNLLTFDVCDLECINDYFMGHMTKRCVLLTHVNISNCIKLTDQTLVHIATNCTDLRHLNISETVIYFNKQPNFTNNGLQSIATGCVLLETLIAAGCQLLSDVGISHVAKHCTELRYIDFTKASVSCNNFIDFGANCRRLRVVKVSECGFLRSYGVVEFAQANARRLEVLSISISQDGSNVTEEALVQLSAYCVNLRELYVEGICDGVTYSRVAVNCPRLSTLHCAYHGVPLTKSELILMGKKCPHLHTLSLPGQYAVTDITLLCLLQHAFLLAELHITGVTDVVLSNASKIWDAIAAGVGPNLQLLELHNLQRPHLTLVAYKRPNLALEFRA